MKELPTVDEAMQDLSDARGETNLMQIIVASCQALSIRPDVDGDYYRRVALTVSADKSRGDAVIKQILSLYPQLK